METATKPATVVSAKKHAVMVRMAVDADLEIMRLRAANAQLVAALRDALIRSDRTMAVGSRDVLQWQDDNRHQGDRLRAALRSLRNEV